MAPPRVSGPPEAGSCPHSLTLSPDPTWCPPSPAPCSLHGMVCPSLLGMGRNSYFFQWQVLLALPNLNFKIIIIILKRTPRLFLPTQSSRRGWVVWHFRGVHANAPSCAPARARPPPLSRANGMRRAARGASSQPADRTPGPLASRSFCTSPALRFGMRQAHWSRWYRSHLFSPVHRCCWYPAGEFGTGVVMRDDASLSFFFAHFIF